MLCVDADFASSTLIKNMFYITAGRNRWFCFLGYEFDGLYEQAQQQEQMASIQVIVTTHMKKRSWTKRLKFYVRP